MNLKKIVASLVFPLTFAASSGPALAATYAGTIITYDVNANAISTRQSCILVQLTGTNVR